MTFLFHLLMLFILFDKEKWVIFWLFKFLFFPDHFGCLISGSITGCGVDKPPLSYLPMPPVAYISRFRYLSLITMWIHWSCDYRGLATDADEPAVFFFWVNDLHCTAWFHYELFALFRICYTAFHADVFVSRDYVLSALPTRFLTFSAFISIFIMYHSILRSLIRAMRERSSPHFALLPAHIYVSPVFEMFIEKEHMLRATLSMRVSSL